MAPVLYVQQLACHTRGSNTSCFVLWAHEVRPYSKQHNKIKVRYYGNYRVRDDPPASTHCTSCSCTDSTLQWTMPFPTIRASRHDHECDRARPLERESNATPGAGRAQTRKAILNNLSRIHAPRDAPTRTHTDTPHIYTTHTRVVAVQTARAAPHADPRRPRPPSYHQARRTPVRGSGAPSPSSIDSGPPQKGGVMYL